MPARQSKQTVKRSTVLKTPTKRASTVHRRQGKTRVTKAKASWKPVSTVTKNYVLHTFDTAVKLLTHKVPDEMYRQVHDALISARNQVAVALETLQGPRSRHDYSHLSATLANLKDMKKQLEQRQATLTTTLQNQEKELQRLEEEKVNLQDFGKLSSKHHRLVMEPLEDELHLNFNTVK